jgi:EmrB/QacA subfamily drug resistance transporter
MAATPPDDGRITWPVARSAVAGSFGSLLSILSATVINVALDHLIADFQSSLDVMQWLSTGYLLTMSLALPLSGWLTSLIGIRRLYLYGLLAFTLTSLLCAGAWSVGSLLAFRILQGVAGGLLAPIFQTVIAQVASPGRIGRLMSYVTLPVVLMPMLGPVIGGFIIEYLSWRWLFIVNVPVGMLGLWLAWRYLPAGEAPPRRPLDLLGLAFVSPGLAALTWGISAFGQAGTLADLTVALPLVGSAVLLTLFVLHALRRKDAIIDLRPFRRATFSLACTTTLVATFVNFGGQLVLPLYLFQVCGLSPAETGLLLAVQGVGMLAGMQLFGTLADRWNAGTVAMLAALISVCGTLPFAFAVLDPPLWLLGLALAVRGFGSVGIVTPSLTAAYRGLERRDLPNASTVQNMVQRMGAPLGSAMLAVVLQWRLGLEPVPAAFGSAFVFAAVATAAAAAAAYALSRAVSRSA